jgi:tetratricopeptide (TPR) repeat protein
MVRGDIGGAAECAQAILSRHPSNADALALMGAVALMAAQVDDAVGLLTRAAAGKPGDPAIRCNLANALLRKGDPAAAESQLRRALKVSPDNPAALCFLAESKAAAGDTGEAKRIYEALLARLPDHPQARLGYADLCVTLGDFPAGRALYRRALALGTVSALALGGLATFEKFAKDSPEATEILRLLKAPGLRPNERVSLGYAAGSIFENAGDYDAAFSYFVDAKRFAGARFDLPAHRKSYATLKGAFTKTFFDERKGLGDKSTRPVFVVGMPRSGTTLTEQILARHPDVAAAGELPDINRIASSLGFRVTDMAPFAKRLTKLASGEVKGCARDYLAVLDRVSTAQRVTDKMPHNFQHLGLIALLFPNAKIVHCRRDPLDTCVSVFTTQLRAHIHGYAGDLETLGLFYREYSSLMDHWREVLPLTIHDLDYEGLIEDPEIETRKLVDFVGLPWDPACLAPHESTRAVHTQSRSQVRQPIYKSSVARWRRYESHLGPLKEALGDLTRN